MTRRILEIAMLAVIVGIIWSAKARAADYAVIAPAPVAGVNYPAPADASTKLPPKDSRGMVDHKYLFSTDPRTIPLRHWNIEGRWTASDAYIAQHIRQTHHIDPTGMTREQMLAAHDAAHEGRASRPQTAPARSYSVQSSGGCPGGVCPTGVQARRGR